VTKTVLFVIRIILATWQPGDILRFGHYQPGFGDDLVRAAYETTEYARFQIAGRYRSLAVSKPHTCRQVATRAEDKLFPHVSADGKPRTPR
jgi:hypothetical protein